MLLRIATAEPNMSRCGPVRPKDRTAYDPAPRCDILQLQVVDRRTTCANTTAQLPARTQATWWTASCRLLYSTWRRLRCRSIDSSLRPAAVPSLSWGQRVSVLRPATTMVHSGRLA